jgi:hypothetical protein
VRFVNITIIEGIGASQYGIGMLSARVAAVILRDERAVFPGRLNNARFATTVSLPSVVGRRASSRCWSPTCPTRKAGTRAQRRTPEGDGAPVHRRKERS